MHQLESVVMQWVGLGGFAFEAFAQFVLMQIGLDWVTLKEVGLG